MTRNNSAKLIQSEIPIGLRFTVVIRNNTVHSTVGVCVKPVYHTASGQLRRTVSRCRGNKYTVNIMQAHDLRHHAPTDRDWKYTGAESKCPPLQTRRLYVRGKSASAESLPSPHFIQSTKALRWTFCRLLASPLGVQNSLIDYNYPQFIAIQPLHCSLSIPA